MKGNVRCGKRRRKKMERKVEKKMGINVNRKMAKEWIDDIREEKGMVGGKMKNGES